MTLHDGITLVACVGELAFALMALGGRTRGPLSAPLALLSVDLFTWNFAALAHVFSGSVAWRWLDLSTSPLAVPLLLHFVLAFVGKRRAFRAALWAAYLGYGLLGLTGALAFFVPGLRAFPGSAHWAQLFLVGLLPVMALLVVLLFRHLAHADGEEKARTWLVLGAVGAGVALASTELWNEMGFPIPGLGDVGTLVGNAMLVLSAGRFQLLGRRLSTARVLTVALLAAVGVAVYWEVFRLLGATLAIRVLAVATLGLALAAGARLTWLRRHAEREHLEHLATVGRFSAQLAHDLKNPLAALKGAAQYLQEAHARGAPPPDEASFLELIIEQTDRLHRVVDHYQRLGRVEPVPVATRLNSLVEQVIALQRFARADVSVHSELSPELPECALDPDLMANALGNLLRNAAEAMPNGGVVTVRTAASDDGVVLSVEDTGQGMDARTRERALEDFFTTKAEGSGLGLAYVRRVAEAHGGRVSLSSQAGRGTQVRIHLPRAPE